MFRYNRFLTILLLIAVVVSLGCTTTNPNPNTTAPQTPTTSGTSVTPTDPGQAAPQSDLISTITSALETKVKVSSILLDSKDVPSNYGFGKVFYGKNETLGTASVLQIITCGSNSLLNLGTQALAEHTTEDNAKASFQTALNNPNRSSDTFMKRVTYGDEAFEETSTSQSLFISTYRYSLTARKGNHIIIMMCSYGDAKEEEAQRLFKTLVDRTPQNFKMDMDLQYTSFEELARAFQNISTTASTPPAPVDPYTVACPVELGVPLDLTVSATDNDYCLYEVTSAEMQRVNFKGWEYGEEYAYATDDYVPASMCCVFGSSEGENINYLYCGGSYSNELTGKTLTDTGEISAVDTYHLKIIFKPDTTTTSRFKVESYTLSQMYPEFECGKRL